MIVSDTIAATRYVVDAKATNANKVGKSETLGVRRVAVLAANKAINAITGTTTSRRLTEEIHAKA
jgi:hypothetical protein